MLEMSDKSPVFSNVASSSLNVFGRTLKTCCKEPLTGFYRDGTCKSDNRDHGNHSVCSILTKEFLDYTKNQGNDLSTPNPRYGFPGLKAGDRWCLCASRWLAAKKAGIEVEVDLEATSIRSLEVITEFDFKWKNRVIHCSQAAYEEQFKELQKNQELTKDLKLIALPIREITTGCQLIGLDGGIKEKSQSIFTLEALSEIINSMPMRIDELEKK